MTRRKTNEEYIKELYKKHKGLIISLEEYKTSKIKILHSCRVCEHTWSALPDNIISKSSGCPKCAGNAKRSIDSYRKELYDLKGDSYTCLSIEYKGSDTPIEHKHNICGYIYNVAPYKILKEKTNCPKCAGNQPRSQETYVSLIKDMEFELIGVYTSGKTKTIHKHKICGYEWEVIPENIIYGQGCPNCARSPSTNVYCVYLQDLDLYKIGITNDVNRRLDELGYSNRLIWVESYDSEFKARNREKILLDKVKDFMYNSGMLKSGNTETFRLDKEWKYYGNL